MPITQLSGPAVAIDGGVSLGAPLTIGTNDAQPLIFETSGTERARFTPTGELIVIGPIVTINSTVVDITDRVFTVNKSAGANDPVPSLMTGLSVYRGAVMGVARDKSVVIWDEPNSRWNFCLNTGGDEIAIGADQNVKLASLLASNEMKLLTNAKALIGRNFANSADIEIVQVNASDEVNIAAGGANITFGGGSFRWEGDANRTLTLHAHGTGSAQLHTQTGTLSLETTTGAIEIATTNHSRSVSIATGGGAAQQSVTVGSPADASSLTLDAGTGAIGIGTSASARAVNIATGMAAQTVAIGSSTGASSLSLYAGSQPISLNGSTYVRDATTGPGTQGLYVVDSSGNGLRIHQNSTSQTYFFPVGSGTTFVLGATGGVVTQGRILPFSDGSLDLGATGQRFRDVYDSRTLHKTHAAFAGSEFVVATGAVQTTTAAITTVFTLAIPDNSMVGLEVSVVARATGSADRAQYTLRAGVFRQAGGAATVLGSVAQTTNESAGAAAWDATITVSGNNALVQVTGAATTINWACNVRHQAVIGNA